jgi:hypothetical protein
VETANLTKAGDCRGLRGEPRVPMAVSDDPVPAEFATMELR